MDQIELAEFAKNSENKEGSEFTPEVQENGIEQGSLIVSKFYNTMLGSITRVMKSWNAEFVKILNSAGIAPSSLTNEQLYNALIRLIRANSVGLQIGDLIPNIGTTSPFGRVLCNGQTITDCKTVFPDFYDYVINHTKTLTPAQWRDQVRIYGQCGYCGVSGDDIIVPLITRPISGVTNIGDAGRAINDTMRPIRGTFDAPDLTDDIVTPEVTGAFYTYVGNYRDSNNGSKRGHAIGFDSSRLGSNYNGKETRGKQIMYPYYIQVYTAAAVDSQVNVQELIYMLKYQNQLGVINIELTSGSIPLESSGIYTMTMTGNTTFVMPSNIDTSMFNQILVQLHIAADNLTIDWGTTKYFSGSPMVAQGYYNMIWEYDKLQNAWIVGQVEKIVV